MVSRAMDMRHDNVIPLHRQGKARNSGAGNKKSVPRRSKEIAHSRRIGTLYRLCLESCTIYQSVTFLSNDTSHWCHLCHSAKHISWGGSSLPPCRISLASVL